MAKSTIWPPYPATRLDRTLIRAEGPDAHHLLDRVITCAMPEPGSATLGALLTPQGKILFDFMLMADVAGFWIDIERTVAADFLKRMMFYRLRADVLLEDRSEDHAVIVSIIEPEGAVFAVRDPRLDALGWRAVVPISQAPDGDETMWHAHRIGLGVPEGGRDYPLGDTFPHDAGMDALGGVDFTKGCFVGQEVVSRMQHRGTARRRPMILTSHVPLSPEAQVRAAGKPIGTVGSTAETVAIAIMRIDRLIAAREAEEPLLVGTAIVEAVRPGWGTWAAPDPLAGFTEEEAEVYRAPTDA